MLENKDTQENLAGDVTNTTDNTKTVDYNGSWTKARVKALIGLIIAMAVILAIGLGFLIYKLTESVLTKKTKIGTPQTELSASSSLKEGIKLNGFQIRHIAASGKQIILHVKKQGNSQLWLIDKSTKTISQKINLID